MAKRRDFYIMACVAVRDFAIIFDFAGFGAGGRGHNDVYRVMDAFKGKAVFSGIGFGGGAAVSTIVLSIMLVLSVFYMRAAMRPSTDD